MSENKTSTEILLFRRRILSKFQAASVGWFQKGDVTKFEILCPSLSPRPNQIFKFDNGRGAKKCRVKACHLKQADISAQKLFICRADIYSNWFQKLRVRPIPISISMNRFRLFKLLNRFQSQAKHKFDLCAFWYDKTCKNNNSCTELSLHNCELWCRKRKRIGCQNC